MRLGRLWKGRARTRLGGTWLLDEAVIGSGADHPQCINIPGKNGIISRRSILIYTTIYYTTTRRDPSGRKITADEKAHGRQRLLKNISYDTTNLQ